MGKDFDNGFGAGFVFGTMMSGGSGSKKDGCYMQPPSMDLMTAWRYGHCGGSATTG